MWETSSKSLDSPPDNHLQSRYVTPGFKPFSYYSLFLLLRLNVIITIVIIIIIIISISIITVLADFNQSWKVDDNVCVITEEEEEKLEHLFQQRLKRYLSGEMIIANS